MPDQGVIKARWHHRHYGWRRGYRGSRNFQSQFNVDYWRLILIGRHGKAA